MQIAYARLHNQRLSTAGFTTPEDAVAWLGAVQAQDYSGAKWALALRMREATSAAIDKAFAAGRILRTHLMRPTWHFVTSTDIRWMLALTAPRVRAAIASYDRRLEIDARLVTRSNDAIAGALQGGVQLTRQELRGVLRKAGIAADGVQRLAHLAIHAELDAVICSGALRHKQFTYALFDERVPAEHGWTREEALAELTRRYFTGHGPAQLQDFLWWSGLKAADARAGLAMVQRDLSRDVLDGRTYWSASSSRALAGERAAYLLPLYDEYLIAYKDRSAALDLARWTRVTSRDPFSAPLVVNGQVVGGWKRILNRDRSAITLTPFMPLRTRDRSAIAQAARRYSSFLGVDLELIWN